MLSFHVPSLLSLRFGKVNLFALSLDLLTKGSYNLIEVTVPLKFTLEVLLSHAVHLLEHRDQPIKIRKMVLLFGVSHITTD
jgi:hypothetical protein